jgi:quinol monooxygenase YgiN
MLDGQRIEENDVDAGPLTVVAVFRARPGEELALGAALRAMLPPTRTEHGCLNYDLHEGNEPGLFYFHETWTSEAHHRAHLDTAHVRHLLEVTPELLLEPIVELKGRRIEV